MENSISNLFIHFPLYCMYYIVKERATKLNSQLIKARLSGMNTYAIRSLKLFSDFLYLVQPLVHTLAQLGWLILLSLQTGQSYELKTVLGTKKTKPVLKFLHNEYSFLRVSHESEI